MVADDTRSVHQAPLPLKVGWALVAVPVLMAILDLVENGCIVVMLWTWPDLSHGLVDVSSLATRVRRRSASHTVVQFAPGWELHDTAECRSGEGDLPHVLRTRSERRFRPLADLALTALLTLSVPPCASLRGHGQ